MNDPLKSGYKTTEFYLAIVSSIVGIAVTLGYITPVQADDLIKALASIIGGLLTISSIGIYVYGRIKLKRDVVESGTNRSKTPINDQIKGLAATATPGVYPA